MRVHAGTCRPAAPSLLPMKAAYYSGLHPLFMLSWGLAWGRCHLCPLSTQYGLLGGQGSHGMRPEAPCTNLLAPQDRYPRAITIIGDAGTGRPVVPWPSVTLTAAPPRSACTNAFRRVLTQSRTVDCAGVLMLPCHTERPTLVPTTDSFGLGTPGIGFCTS